MFIDHLYGELGERAAASLQAHLDACPECSTRLAELTRIREHVARQPDPEPSRLAVQRVLAQAKEASQTPCSLWGLKWLRVVAPFCFMVVVGGLFLYQYREDQATKELSHSPREEVPRTPISEPAREVKRDDSLEQISRSEKDGESKVFYRAPASTPTPAERQSEPQAPGPMISRSIPPEDKKQFAGAKVPAVDDRAEKEEAMGTSGQRRAKEQFQSAPKPTTPGKAVKIDDAFTSKVRIAERKSKSEAAGLEVAGAKKMMARQPVRKRAVGRLQEQDTGATSEEATGRDEFTKAPKVIAHLSSISARLDGAERALEAENHDEALRAFSELVDRLAPGHPERSRALLGKAKAYEGLGKVAEAKAVYRELAEESPAHRDLAERKLEELSRE
jgi:hypothetical protein